MIAFQVMEFGVSTRLFYGETLGVDVLERIRGAGFDRIEICGNRPHFDFNSRGVLRGIGRWFEENEVPAPSLHLPFEQSVERGHRLLPGNVLSALAPDS